MNSFWRILQCLPRRFVCAFTIQISIHNTLLINTTFICIKYARSDSTTRDADESEKATDETEHMEAVEKKRDGNGDNGVRRQLSPLSE